MEEIDLKLLIKEFWKRKILIILLILICFIISGIYLSLKKEEKYITTTTLIISEKELNEEKESNITGISNIMIALIKSDTMMNEINNKIDYKPNKESVNVSNNTNNVININVTDTDKQKSIDVANSIVEVLKEKIGEIEQLNNINIDIINFADESCIKTSNTNNKLLICFAISIFISFGTVFVIYILDTRIKNADQIKKDFDVELIDSLELMKKEGNSIENDLTTIFDFKSKNSNIFKIIVTKILNKVNAVDENVLLITSVNKREGKTYVASNIGTVLAMFGKKVIIVDTNFDDPKLNKIFKVPNSLGLSNYLTGINGKGQEIKETLNNFIQETDIKNLNVITAGDVKENITNCLVSDRFDEFIKQLKFYYDFIIIDSNKILNTPNTLILSEKANNTIIVVDKYTTKAEDFVKVKNDICSVNGKLLGVILNETEKQNIFTKKIINIKNKEKINTNNMLEENFKK